MIADEALIGFGPSSGPRLHTIKFWSLVQWMAL